MHEHILSYTSSSINTYYPAPYHLIRPLTHPFNAHFQPY